MIDAHCHMAFGKLEEIADNVLDDAKKSMKLVVTCGLPKDYEKTLEIASRHKDFVFVSLGVHPEDVIEMADSEVEKNIEFIKNNADKIVAIGEIGLDYKWTNDPDQIERCKKYFEKCLDMAEELNLPVVLHSRKAEEDVFEIVSKRKLRKVVFHHYSGNMTLAEKILEKGYYLSLPTLTHNSKTLRKIAKNFPLENLLTETDSPFNSPVQGEQNIPQNVKFTLKLLSELRGESLESIEKKIDENASKIFLSNV